MQHDIYFAIMSVGMNRMDQVWIKEINLVSELIKLLVHRLDIYYAIGPVWTNRA